MSSFKIKRYNWSELTFPIERCKGLNSRNVLVLIEEDDLNTNSALLKRVIQSVGLDLEQDLSLLALDKDEYISLLSSPHIANYSKILSFGIPVERFGPASIKATGLLQFEKVMVVVSAPLGQIASDEQKKRLLWANLKTLFNK